MATKYAFYPGCAAKGATRELYESSIAVSKRLGIDLIELASFSCCGAGTLEEIKEEVDIAVNARNLALAEKENLDIVTVCATCLLTLRKAKYMLDNDEELRDKTNEILSKDNLEYKGTSDVKLFHWVLLDEFGDSLNQKALRPLKGLKVYPFYGCHSIRPEKIIGYESSENPSSLERIIDATGAKPVDGKRRLECCGFHSLMPNPELSMKLTGLILNDAFEMGSDCIVTPCPLCHMNLDANQGKALKAIGKSFSMPILHTPQLVGLALGLDEVELGLQRNIVPFNLLKV